MKRGSIPQKPVTIVTEDGDDAALEAVNQRVDKAQATADNARQMVMNRDPRLTTLEGLATDYQERVAESQADRAALHTAVASLAADVQNEAENRADADAAHQVAISGLNARIDTIQLTPGPDGKSAYQVARAAGYGGTETQWLASLKGQDGKDGTAQAVAVGTGRLTAVLLLGGTVDVPVALSRTMPNTSYQVGIAPTTGMAFTVKARTPTTVTVTVTAALALAVGATFTLIAWA